MAILKFLSKFGDDFIRFFDDGRDFWFFFKTIWITTKNGYWYIIPVIIFGIFICYYLFRDDIDHTQNKKT